MICEDSNSVNSPPEERHIDCKKDDKMLDDVSVSGSDANSPPPPDPRDADEVLVKEERELKSDISSAASACDGVVRGPSSQTGRSASCALLILPSLCSARPVLASPRVVRRLSSHSRTRCASLLCVTILFLT